jgi:folylpolyglutamate synthase/dihydropteroate synthase
VQRAASLGPSAGPVVVAGSLYLVGAIRATLTGEQPDA